MYCATPDGTGCDCPTSTGKTLAGYGFTGTSLAPGGMYGFDPGGSFSSTPGGYSSSFDVGGFLGDVWDHARDLLGDVGADLKDDFVDWIQRRIGQEAWEAMPESSKREVTRQAAIELTGGLAAPNVLPWVVAIGAGLFALSRAR
jgi:hypothetical protein